MSFLTKRLAALEKVEGAGDLEIAFSICDEAGQPETTSFRGQAFVRRDGETKEEFNRRVGLNPDFKTITIGGEEYSNV